MNLRLNPLYKKLLILTIVMGPIVFSQVIGFLANRFVTWRERKFL